MGCSLPSNKNHPCLERSCLPSTPLSHVTEGISPLLSSGLPHSDFSQGSIMTAPAHPFIRDEDPEKKGPSKVNS